MSVSNSSAWSQSGKSLPGAEAFAPGAYAVINTEPPEVLLAENAQVISRLIAMKIVAGLRPS